MSVGQRQCFLCTQNIILSRVSFHCLKVISQWAQEPIRHHETHGSVAHPDAVDPNAGGRVHHAAGAQFGLDGWVEDGLLFLQVQNEPQLRQREAGGPSQAKQRVVEVHGVTA